MSISKENVQEFKRLRKKKEQLLYLLKLRGDKGMTNVEMAKIATRYGGHIGTLYQEGYVIDVVSVDKEKGVNRYILKSCPLEPIKRATAKELLIERINDFGEVDSETLFEIFDELGINIKFKPNTYKESNKKII